NTWSQDSRETWDDEEVKRWVENCRALQNQYYNGYEGAEFHIIDCSQEGNLELLTAKICYALFGMPTEADATTLLDGYNSDQQKDASVFVDRICDMYTLGKRATVEIMPIFVCCKSNEYEYTLPVFRLRLEDETIKYIDTFKRVYTSWQHWQTHNKFPMMKYCYPTPGLYSCSEAKVEYKDDESVCLTFDSSPSCNLPSRIASMLDVTSLITSVGSSGILIAGMFTPLAPALLVGGGMVGLGGAVWGTTRSMQRMVDKGQHGESWTDLESMTSWLAIALMPLSVATSAINASIANGARASGRIFSTTVRSAATILNCTTLGLQSGMLVLGLANLVQKAKNKQLSSLDVLQFSMTVFFFTNTVMQPKTASGIIAKAQSEHIQQYRESMTDETARSTFDRFLKQNKGDGIKEMSKIIRNLNKIETPDQVFKGLSNADNISIGGRKGNTLLVSKEGTAPTRVSVKSPLKTSLSLQSIPISVDQQKLMDDDVDSLRGAASGRSLYIEGVNDYEAMNLNEILEVSGRNYSNKIMAAGISLWRDLDVKNVDDACSVLDLVVEYGGSEAELTSRLDHFMSEGRSEFLDSLRDDIARAREIANAAGRVYESVIKMVALFRKHGEEFVHKRDPMDSHLAVLPKQFFV
ncbi:hypothetical protein PENTCL1PPCAC_11953, partial [Pristionchus entomophagus]